ncbi:MAG: Sin3 associated polypeptide p18-domain-containing protein [Olpidium bornovanus]|uniref:Sin3 associated polypeptide p18-domain-containing protein n=1 Tax=Olpidium bornovanus TaxID=278681 RepID=A0A8H7ZNJ8_9FUNG|nr:MAG: Sin3 associated polypeptide p18-domain-containing protein [Olpidium bornovanus]
MFLNRKDATMREIGNLIKSSSETAASVPFVRMSFRLIFRNKTSGKFTVKDLGVVVPGRSPSRDEEKTLSDVRFEIGDYVDVAFFSGTERRPEMPGLGFGASAGGPLRDGGNTGRDPFPDRGAGAEAEMRGTKDGAPARAASPETTVGAATSAEPGGIPGTGAVDRGGIDRTPRVLPVTPAGTVAEETATTLAADLEEATGAVEVDLTAAQNAGLDVINKLFDGDFPLASFLSYYAVPCSSEIRTF